jgi:hypothetical protein
MRVVLSVSAVLTCGLLASLSSLVQSAPSKAASFSVAAVASDAAAVRSTPAPDVIEIRKSGSVEAHFAAANTTHDGHLTRDQALKVDWTRVLHHFDDIDTGHNGWVTVGEIHAYNQSHRKHH